MSSGVSADSDLLTLQSAFGVRSSAKRLFDYVANGHSAHFTLDMSRLSNVVDAVADVTLAQYPDLNVPFHSRLGHFGAGGINRLNDLESRLADESPDTRRRALVDLIVTSVLLDAGAGPHWRYKEQATGHEVGRSEGLAVASYWCFMHGGFSSDPQLPLRADALGLTRVTKEGLEASFQVHQNNPLVGVEGRVQLLRRLGSELAQAANVAPAATHAGGARPSDVLTLIPIVDGCARANDVLVAVLRAFGGVWPGRETFQGVNLGDVWTHSQLGHIAFHKLSQWLSYSLCDALQRTGVVVTGLDELTGLAEYRNGGLFLDLGVIVPKSPGLLNVTHAVGSDVVIEWRALTVALLDLTAAALRQRWGKTAEQLPLVKVLEGGTWHAGRKLAAELRADASSPLSVHSDGTVF